MDVELNHLKYFYYTVLENGVAGAADRLCVQQPVVSKMLRKLEDQFGRPLFEKVGRKKQMTDFGQLVFRHCQNIFQEVDKLSEVAFDSKTSAGSLSVGASDLLNVEILPKAVQSLKQECPEIHANVYVASANQIIEMIGKGTCELGLLFHLPNLPEEFEILQRISVPHVVAAKKSATESTLESFIGSRELDDRSTTKFPTVELLKEKRPKTSIKYSSNSLSHHKSLVALGAGVSVLPYFCVSKELSEGEFINLLEGVDLNFDMKVVVKKGNKPAAATGKLLLEIEKLLT